MSGQRQECDLLSNWATGELCEAQAAHRGSGMGDLGLPSPPAEVKLGVEPGWGGVLSWLGRSGTAQNMCGLVALSAHRLTWVALSGQTQFIL